MKGELRRAGCCGGFVAQWLWRLHPDTLSSSPAVAGLSLFSSLSKQVVFHTIIYIHHQHTSFYMAFSAVTIIYVCSTE